MNKLKYRLLTKEEFTLYLNQFKELFKICFHREIDISYFKWRYLDNCNNDLFVYVAFDNDKLIGNYSVFPCEFNMNGKIKKIGLSMTTMTHPNYKGRGIFTTLAERLYEEMRKQGYVAVFGFPNNNSHKIFIKKLGWNDIYEIPNFTLDNITNMYIESDYKIILDNNFRFDYNMFFDQNKKIMLNKNKKYLQWRFTKNPINNYKNYTLINTHGKLISNCVIKYYNDEMDIVEINTIDEEQVYMFINNIIAVNRNKIKKVNTWINVASYLHNVYENLGFVNQMPITYFGVKKLDNDLNDDIYNYREWSIQMSDSDVY